MSISSDVEGDQDDVGKHTAWLDATLKNNGKAPQIPRRLYKFVSPGSEYFRSSLRQLFLYNRVFLPSREALNDPFDTRPAFDPAGISSDQIKEFWRAVPQRNGLPKPSEDEVRLFATSPDDHAARLRAGFDVSLDGMGIFSMCANIENPLMWAHYAAGHRGMAIIFKHAHDGFGALPVRYQTAYPRFSPGRRSLDDDIYEMLVKGRAWQYEEEWRLVESRKSNQWLDISPNVLSGIVFGLRTSEDTIRLVMGLANNRAAQGLPPIQIYGASQAPSSFDLEFSQLQNGGLVKVTMPNHPGLTD